MPKSFTANDAICVDRFIYSEFILYKNLRPITVCFKGLNPPILNVYIDLYSLIVPLYSFYKFENPISLTSSLINAGIHYRNFFNKMGIYTNIFLVYSPNMSQNNLRYCPGYNLSYINKMFGNYETKMLVEKNLELIGTIIPYIPDMYLKIGTVEPSVIIVSMIKGFESRGYVTKNLVVSPSAVGFQIPVMDKNSVVFSKRRNGEVLVTTCENSLSQAISYTKNQNISGGLGDIPQEYVSGFYTLCGLGKVGVNALVYYNTGLEILRYVKEHNMVMDADTLCEAYMGYYKGKKKTVKDVESICNQIHNRFRCFDFKHQLSMYKNLPESEENSYLVQIRNDDELFRLNREYFRNNPIMLDKL